MVEIRRPKKRYEDHRKAFAAARDLETNLGEPAPAATGAASAVERPVKPVADQVLPRASPAARPKRATHTEEKLRVKFTLQAPQPGAFDYFDRAAAQMGDGKALRLVLARAFDQFEASVAAGENVLPATYPIDPTRSASTSRHISMALYTSAKAALDPMDLLPPGSFGRELAMTVLAQCLRAWCGAQTGFSGSDPE